MKTTQKPTIHFDESNTKQYQKEKGTYSNAQQFLKKHLEGYAEFFSEYGLITCSLVKTRHKPTKQKGVTYLGGIYEAGVSFAVTASSGGFKRTYIFAVSADGCEHEVLCKALNEKPAQPIATQVSHEPEVQETEKTDIELNGKGFIPIAGLLASDDIDDVKYSLILRLHNEGLGERPMLKQGLDPIIIDFIAQKLGVSVELIDKRALFAMLGRTKTLESFEEGNKWQFGEKAAELLYASGESNVVRITAVQESPPAAAKAKRKKGTVGAYAKLMPNSLTSFGFVARICKILLEKNFDKASYFSIELTKPLMPVFSLYMQKGDNVGSYRTAAFFHTFGTRKLLTKHEDGSWTFNKEGAIEKGFLSKDGEPIADEVIRIREMRDGFAFGSDQNASQEVPVEIPEIMESSDSVMPDRASFIEGALENKGVLAELAARFRRLKDEMNSYIFQKKQILEAAAPIMAQYRISEHSDLRVDKRLIADALLKSGMFKHHTSQKDGHNLPKWYFQRNHVIEQGLLKGSGYVLSDKEIKALKGGLKSEIKHSDTHVTPSTRPADPPFQMVTSVTEEAGETEPSDELIAQYHKMLHAKSELSVTDGRLDELKQERLTSTKEVSTLQTEIVAMEDKIVHAKQLVESYNRMIEKGEGELKLKRAEYDSLQLSSSQIRLVEIHLEKDESPAVEV